MNNVAPKRAIKLDVMQDDPVFVEFYTVAGKAIDLIEVSVFEALNIPQQLRRDVYLLNWTAYIGTLLEETAVAVQQLLVLDMPRAAIIMNRQVFEYGVRLAYLYRHPEKAEALMDSLPHLVWKESKNAPGFFSAETREIYETNYRNFVRDNPELDSKTGEPDFTGMAKEILGERFDSDFFHYYAIASILAHAKPQGIVDVLESKNGTLCRHKNSIGAHAPDELAKLVFFLLNASKTIRERFKLPMEPVREVNQIYGTALDTRRVEGQSRNLARPVESYSGVQP